MFQYLGRYFHHIAKYRGSKKISLEHPHYKSPLCSITGLDTMLKEEFRTCPLTEIDISRMMHNTPGIGIFIIDSYLHLLNPIYRAFERC
jgi:hypothetical protein